VCRHGESAVEVMRKLLHDRMRLGIDKIALLK
jgi:hypothetical protein